MGDIVKGVLAGGWALLVGWILPTALGLAVFGVLVLPSLDHIPILSPVAGASAAGQAATLAAAAAAAGLTLSALATPLYRILEGYVLWPKRLQRNRIAHHVQRRRLLQEGVDRAAAAASEGDLATDLAVEAWQRYPPADSQIAPTQLGNAIRRLEYYGYDRYQFDSQLMWYQLRSVVPESTTKDVDNARASVDFFVCLLYVLLLLGGTAALAFLSASAQPWRLGITVALAVLGLGGCYRAAVAATDSWAAAVKAMVDIGRTPLAKALGLVLPDTLADEREMWLNLSWLVKFGYDEHGSKTLDRYRCKPTAGAPHPLPSER